MSFLAEYFGEKRYINFSEEVKKKSPRPKSVDSSSSSSKEIKKTISELIESDWFTFATMNLCSTMFSKPNYEIVSEGKEQWEKFFTNMRLYGNNTSLRRLRSNIKRDMCSFGSGFVEFIPDEENMEILDLKKIDASKMNPAKDNKRHLILDYKGNSIGYVLSLGSNADLGSKGDQIPEGYEGMISLQNGDIFMLPERVAEFKLYDRQNGIESIGLIEPSIQQTNRRRSLETAQVNAIWIRGTAPLFALVGDSVHEPTPQMLTDALDSLLDMKHSNASSFPYYMEPKTLDAKIDDIATTVSDSLLSASASSAGIPLPFVTGQGEATNRSTLKTQREMFEDNLQEKIKNFDEDWNLLIMDRISKTNEFAEGKIISGNIKLESADEFAKRLKIYSELGAMSPKEFRMNIKKMDSLEFDEKDYEKYVKEKEEKQKMMNQISEKTDETDKIQSIKKDKKLLNSKKNTTNQ